jgi:hypothetical protein
MIQATILASVIFHVIPNPRIPFSNQRLRAIATTITPITIAFQPGAIILPAAPVLVAAACAAVTVSVIRIVVFSVLVTVSVFALQVLSGVSVFDPEVLRLPPIPFKMRLPTPFAPVVVASAAATGTVLLPTTRYELPLARLTTVPLMVATGPPAVSVVPSTTMAEFGVMLMGLFPGPLVIAKGANVGSGGVDAGGSVILLALLPVP